MELKLEKYKLLEDITCYKTKRVIAKKNENVELVSKDHYPVILVKNNRESFSVHESKIKEV